MNQYELHSYFRSGYLLYSMEFNSTRGLGFCMLMTYCFLLADILFLANCEVPKYSFIHEATSAPLISYFDYIIIGGGTSGCPLAATLSHGANVLVLERGGSPYGNPNITKISNYAVPFLDNSPSSPSQQFVSEDGVYNNRARVLGGGTALNAGFYTRASTEYVRKAGWDEGLAWESYEWVEKKVAFKPVVGQWQLVLKEGLLEAGVLPNNGFTYDYHIGTKIGGTIFDPRGHRHTAADLLEYANPGKITVLLHATVHKILFSQNGN